MLICSSPLNSMTGIQLQFMASFSASLMALFIKFGSWSGLTPMTFVLARSLLLLAASAPMNYRRDNTYNVVLRPKTLAKLFLVGISSHIVTLTTVMSVVYLSIADATMLWALAPLIGASLSPFILREEVPPSMIKVLPLALVGVALIVQPPLIFGGQARPLNAVGLGIGLAQVCNSKLNPNVGHAM